MKILRDLGAIVLGKAETTQFATTDPARTRNPWNLDRSPGGSSAGSAAAVASGMCLAALGTQTGGSITRPASFCGVASFKGAWGAWPLEGIVPVSQHLDHVGPMARSIADLALLWTLVEARLHPERAADLARLSEAVIAGEWFECAPPPRLAVIEDYYSETSGPAALEAFRASIARLEAAGATIGRLPLHASFAGMHASHRLVMAVEAAEVHREDFAERPDTYRPIITRLIEKGLAASAVDYRAACVHRQRFAVDLAAALDAPAGPVIALTPATVASAPPLAEGSTGGPAVQLGVVVQRAADLRGAGMPRRGRPAAQPAARRGPRIVRAVPGRGLVRGGAGVPRERLKGGGPRSSRPMVRSISSGRRMVRGDRNTVRSTTFAGRMRGPASQGTRDARRCRGPAPSRSVG